MNFKEFIDTGNAICFRPTDETAMLGLVIDEAVLACISRITPGTTFDGTADPTQTFAQCQNKDCASHDGHPDYSACPVLLALLASGSESQNSSS